MEFSRFKSMQSKAMAVHIEELSMWPVCSCIAVAKHLNMMSTFTVNKESAYPVNKQKCANSAGLLFRSSFRIKADSNPNCWPRIDEMLHHIRMWHKIYLQNGIEWMWSMVRFLLCVFNFIDAIYISPKQEHKREMKGKRCSQKLKFYVYFLNE